jgi:replicative DNA helicase
MRIEQTILKNLLHDEDYARKVVPHLREEYFQDKIERAIASQILKFFIKFNKPATVEVIDIELGNDKTLFEADYAQAQAYTKELKVKEDINLKWLVDATEKFCKDKAVYNSIMDSIKIIDGRDKVRRKDIIPSLLSDALAVSFDKSVGHDYLENTEERFDFYKRTEEKIPFDIDLFNVITRGGISNKTLNVALAGTGVGKSLFLCHFASANLMNNLNVLYITLEMSEEKIAERIDSNLLNITMDELKIIDKFDFNTRVDRVKMKTKGKLVIKEFPTASAHVGHFKSLLDELKIKKDFTPDVIYIDYLNLCVSARLKYGGNNNSYTVIKSIAEELRGLAVQYDLPIMTATQTTRQGFTSSDLGLEDTSESFGLPATADFMFAIIATEDMIKEGIASVKQLKNRYNDPNYYKRFVVGVERNKMKVYNLETEHMKRHMALADAGDSKPVFDKGSIGERIKAETTSSFKFDE